MDLQRYSVDVYLKEFWHMCLVSGVDSPKVCRAESINVVSYCITCRRSLVA